MTEIFYCNICEKETNHCLDGECDWVCEFEHGAITKSEKAVLEAAERWFNARNEPSYLTEPRSTMLSYCEYRDAGYDLNDAVAKMLKAKEGKT